MVAEGSEPIAISLQMLMDGRAALHLSWSDQEEPFGD